MCVSQVPAGAPSKTPAAAAAAAAAQSQTLTGQQALKLFAAANQLQSAVKSDKPQTWVAVEELHNRLKTEQPEALAGEESERKIQQRVKDMFPGGDKGLVKAFEANPALFGTLKDPMSKPVERCIRAFVSDPKNDISPQRAMSIFKALNEGNVSNGKPPTLSEIATDYALKTSASGNSIDFKKLSMTINSLVHLGLDMDAVSETLLQSSRNGGDNLPWLTEDSAGYLLAAKAILSEHSSPETKRLMAISDSFKYLATKAGAERDFLDQFSVKTEAEFLVKVKDSRLIDEAKQKGIKMPENLAEVDARRDELKTSGVTALEISAALQSMTVSSLATIDGLISSPAKLREALRRQIDSDAYAPTDKELKNLATTKVSDIALAHLAQACVETLAVNKAEVNNLVKKLDSRLKTFRSLVNAWQKNFSPEKYKERKLDKLETLVNNIQKKVNENRLTWDQETRTLAVAMVSQKITQYIAQLDKLGASPEVKAALMEQRDALLAKIDGVVSKLTVSPNAMTIEGQDYKIGKQIFEGTAAKVHRCVNNKTQEECVVKLITVSDLTISTSDALRQVNMAQNFFGNPNIMSHSAVAITVSDGPGEIQTMAIVMPYANKGDIEKVVAELAEKSLAENTPVFLQLLTDAATGLCAIHEQGFVHGDIKPANIFVKTGANGNLTGMVGDLDTMHPESDPKPRAHEGSPPYTPVISSASVFDRNRLDSSEKSSPSIDTYAFGMMAFELLSGGFLPVSDTPRAEFNENENSSYPMPDTKVLRERIDARLPNASPAVKLLIENSLSAAPADRPTMLAWRDALLSEQRRG